MIRKYIKTKTRREEEQASGFKRVCVGVWYKVFKLKLKILIFLISHINMAILWAISALIMP